jgi:hypothetical protein
MTIINSPVDYLTNETEWWFIYDENTNQIVVPPMQCSGITSSPYTLGVGQSEEECLSYIEEKNLQNTVDIPL